MISKKFIDDQTEASIEPTKNGDFVKITVKLNRHIIEINLSHEETNELINELLINMNYAKQ
jgi:hypothetical protein